MVGVIRFIREEPESILGPLTFTALLAGASSSAMVILINAGAVAVHSQATSTKEFFLFLIAFKVFVVSSLSSGRAGRRFMETTLSKLRIRLFDKMRKARLRYIESLSSNEVIATTSKDVGQILQATDNLVFSFQSLIMLITSLIFMATVSLPALIIIVLGMAVLGYFRYLRSDTTRSNLKELINQERTYSRLVAHLLHGFKETKLNKTRSQALYRSFIHTAEDAKNVGLKTGYDFIRMSTTVQSASLATLAVIVFILPRFTETFTNEILVLTTLAVFIFGAISHIVTSLPEFAQADVALSNLYELEHQLDEALERFPTKSATPIGSFSQLAFDNVEFSYLDPEGRPTFSVGPISLLIRTGDIHFIVGGNGSGKSTLLKLLTGLYQPRSGKILLDDVPLDTYSLVEYRNRFAAVFSSAHLFDRLYGLENVEDTEVQELIHKMRLQEKVQYARGSFSTLELSTGQRKRLALIRALLEDRDIYIFDEWAAEQDRYFRKYFYETILLDLKRQGKTVIAVTHDESFLDVADWVFNLDDPESTA